MSRQSSLAEDRINSSDEDEFLEERSGMLPHRSKNIRPLSYPFADACLSSILLSSNQPDLIRDLKSFRFDSTDSLNLEISVKDCLRNDMSISFGCKSDSLFPNSSINHSFVKIKKLHESTRTIKKTTRKNFLTRSCVAQ